MRFETRAEARWGNHRELVDISLERIGEEIILCEGEICSPAEMIYEGIRLKFTLLGGTVYIVRLEHNSAVSIGAMYRALGGSTKL